MHRARSRVVALVVVAAFAGCDRGAGAGTPVPQPVVAAPPVAAPAPAPGAVAAPVAPGQPVAPPVQAARGPGRYPFAPSSLTPLAIRLTDIAMAAVEGRPLPQNGIAHEPVEAGRPLVSTSGDSPPPPPGLAVFGLGMELEIVVASPQAEVSRTFRTGLFVGDRGLRLIELDLRDPRPASPLPPSFSDLEAAAGVILEAVRSGTAGSLLFTEADATTFNHDELFREVLEDRPSPADLEAAAGLLRAGGRATGYRVDDVGILARAPDGSVYALRMDLEQSPDRIVLDARPLVRARRFDRR